MIFYKEKMNFKYLIFKFKGNEKKELVITFKDHYKNLTILKNYLVINEIGIIKIMNKFNKKFSVNLNNHMEFDIKKETLNRISKLIDTSAEETVLKFANLFYNGNIEKAKEKLKISPNHRKKSHSK
jgi:hypothetical protein